MKKGIFIFLILAVFSPDTFAQPAKAKTSVNQIWGGYFNQTRLSDKWGIWAEAQLRTKEELVTDLSVGIARLGLTYYVNDASKLTAGYAFVNFFPSDNHKKISQPEHRIWQQFQWHTKFQRNWLMQWFRLEERFRRKIKNDSTLSDGYLFNYRVRYNVWY
ncbi:MAG: DUF2490 domain-containing protein, partial [Gemmatimonadaceae bacterium]|nr:DUF2490 domain-containing protein [Chitinophagaceae bacterium]